MFRCVLLQANKIPSLDTLNFVMESLACGHVVMSHRDAHEAMEAAAGPVGRFVAVRLTD
jgi:hypothetical protein